jgi:hypothetical protein
VTRPASDRLLRFIPYSWAKPLAWSFFALFVAGTIAEIRLRQLTEDDFTAVDAILFPLEYTTFAIVGALLASRRPHNPLGWLFLAIGTGATFGNAAQGYADLALVQRPGSLPAGIWAAWYGSLAWPCSMALILFLPILFPDGKVARRWLKPFLWGGIAGWVSLFITFAFEPGPLDMGPREDPMINPMGIEALEPVSLVFVILLFLLPTMLVMGLFSLTLRAVRSSGVERQQLKWLAFGTAGFALLFMGQPLLTSFLGERSAAAARWGNVLFGLAVMMLPISMGIAIARYRLYDLGRIVNRAVVYASLTVVLAGIYLVGVTVIRSGLAPVTGDSDIAVAASTLAVAALFRPARKRIQAFIDHRFYRRKYNATRTVDDFSAKLRDEIDLTTLNDELVGVVHQTMHPTHVSVWLRPTT